MMMMCQNVKILNGSSDGASGGDSDVKFFSDSSPTNRSLGKALRSAHFAQYPGVVMAQSSGELFSLPAGPATLCFDKNEFMKKTFSVDEFLHDNRNAGSLEMIRDDLGVYLRVLRSAMIELINQDYADFVDLSANLIGLDQQIEAIGGPLGKLKEEIETVRAALEGSMREIAECLERKKALRSYKKSLQSLGQVQGSLEKLEGMLCAGERINATLLERAALESIQLQFNIKFCREFLDDGKQQLAERLWNELLGRLQEYFLQALGGKDCKELERCLRIYCTLDECVTAERVFRDEVVSPFMNRVISESSLQNSPQGLTGIYNQLLDFVSMNMKQLCQLTKRNGKVKGYNFIVNSFWTEVERRMETNMSSIFAPGNPDAFYQKYKCTVEFLERIELIIEDRMEVARFKAHPQYRSFQVRWNLPVYFQIRFQEIGASLESACDRNLEEVATLACKQISASQFNVLQFTIALTCISKCWQEGVYLPQLYHRFLKLTLQILARLTVWCDEAITYKSAVGSAPASRVKFLVVLFSDVSNTARKIPSIARLAIEKCPTSAAVAPEELERVIGEHREKLLEKLQRVQVSIVQELIRSCLGSIRQAGDIPRLYRKTNREVPSRCSQYVDLVLGPTEDFRATYGSMIGEERVREFLAEVYGQVTTQYFLVIDEVLTSVQKTEESLRRLKNLRDRSTTGAAGGGGSQAPERTATAMSDDDKIRLQLHVDVQHFVRHIEGTAGLPRSQINKLPELIQLVEDATKARM